MPGWVLLGALLKLTVWWETGPDRVKECVVGCASAREEKRRWEEVLVGDGGLRKVIELDI